MLRTVALGCWVVAPLLALLAVPLVTVLNVGSPAKATETAVPFLLASLVVAAAIRGANRSA